MSASGCEADILARENAKVKLVPDGETTPVFQPLLFVSAGHQTITPQHANPGG
jgi:hypothetical protein